MRTDETTRRPLPVLDDACPFGEAARRLCLSDPRAIARWPDRCVSCRAQASRHRAK